MTTKKIFLLSALVLGASAAANAAEWEVGSPVASNVKATYSAAEKTLTISGTGAMQNFTGPLPWSAERGNISIVVIGKGVTNIGDNAFKDCSSVLQVRLPSSDVTNIGANVFAGCTNLVHIFLTKDNPPTLNATAFGSLDKSKIGVFVPTPDMYKAANSGWHGFIIKDAYCTDCN